MLDDVVADDGRRLQWGSQRAIKSRVDGQTARVRRVVHTGHPQAGPAGSQDSTGEFERHDGRLSLPSDDEHGAAVCRSRHELPVDDDHPSGMPDVPKYPPLTPASASYRVAITLVGSKPETMSAASARRISRVWSSGFTRST